MFATLEHKDTELASMSNTNDKKDFAFLQGRLRTELALLYDLGEIQAIAKELAMATWGKSMLDIITEKLVLTAEQLDLLEQQMSRLANAEPLQYVLGFAYFAGRQFIVNNKVLIPRPETEELAKMVVTEILPKQCPTVLDIGCGSGCIIATIAIENKSTRCNGIDISAEALKLARQNCELLGAKVAFFESDVLDEAFAFDMVDIIVSNPPYIPLAGKKDMHKNVVAFEPHSALFVNDDDAYLFYRKIAEVGRKILSLNGKIYFETHVDGAEHVAQILKDSGYNEVNIFRDMNGHERFVKCAF
jgi:release factor glutamine methyltransferase